MCGSNISSILNSKMDIKSSSFNCYLIKNKSEIENFDRKLFDSELNQMHCYNEMNKIL